MRPCSRLLRRNRRVCKHGCAAILGLQRSAPESGIAAGGSQWRRRRGAKAYYRLGAV
jgi:hypothetical protein